LCKWQQGDPAAPLAEGFSKRRANQSQQENPINNNILGNFMENRERSAANCAGAGADKWHRNSADRRAKTTRGARLAHT
jgi:hypothetical protein